MSEPDTTSEALAVHRLTEAIRLTVEYVGNDTLPAVPGWSWFDALTEYRPEAAQWFTNHPVILGRPDAPTPTPAEVVHRMLTGSHESARGPECRCGAEWDRWNDQCATVGEDAS